MFDDDICNAADMNKLKAVCKNNGLVRCDKCDHVEPNAGHDVPYCLKLTKLGKGKGITCSSSTKGRAPYKLKKGNIPKRCKHWLSASKMLNERESKCRVKETQSMMDKLTPSERAKIK